MEEAADQDILAEDSGIEFQGCQGKPFKHHKQQRDESRREKVKRLRNNRQSYINVKGNIIPLKVFINVDCGSTKRCFASKTENEGKGNLKIFIKLEILASKMLNCVVLFIKPPNRLDTLAPEKKAKKRCKLVSH